MRSNNWWTTPLSFSETRQRGYDTVGSSVAFALHGVPIPGEWADRGVCRGEDPDIWFPTYRDTEAVAREMCGRCPVRRECREYAVPHPALKGIWGNSDETERRAERMRRLGVAI
jgi:WhiB family redox-sensing transcriptional regulator